jgi:hypothetical protein
MATYLLKTRTNNIRPGLMILDKTRTNNIGPGLIMLDQRYIYYVTLHYRIPFRRHGPILEQNVGYPFERDGPILA